jgi:hypothetical protein
MFKFGVASGISNLLSLGGGTREPREEKALNFIFYLLKTEQKALKNVQKKKMNEKKRILCMRPIMFICLERISSLLLFCFKFGRKELVYCDVTKYTQVV